MFDTTPRYVPERLMTLAGMRPVISYEPTRQVSILSVARCGATSLPWNA
jgi:hypothetical protein